VQELARTKFYGPLTMFGHDFSVAEAAAAAAAAESGDDNPSGAPKVPLQEKLPPEQEMGSFLPLLLDLSNFISRLYSLSRNLLNQLACLFHERQKLWMTTFKFIHLDLPFQSLGELASILLTLDAIVLDNPNFVTFWTAFKRMIKYIRADPARYGMDNPIKLRLFETMLLALDRGILSGRMFENLLEMDYGLQQATAVASAGGATAASAVPSTAATLVAGNRVLYETMTSFIRSWFKRLTHGLGDVNNTVETYPRIHIVECYALYALQRALFRNTFKPDKTLFTDLWNLQKKIAIIPLFGRACWFPADFLGRHAPIDLKNLTPSGKQVAQVRSEILAAADETFVGKTEELYNQLAVWMVSCTTLRTRSRMIVGGRTFLTYFPLFVCCLCLLCCCLHKRFESSPIWPPPRHTAFPPY
jgi:WASH complex subunit 7